VIASAALRDVLGPDVAYEGPQTVEEAFTDSPSDAQRTFWRTALGVEQPIQAYYVATGDDALLYSIRPEPVGLRVRLPFVGRGYVANGEGARLDSVQSDDAPLQVVVRPNQYTYLTRVLPGD
jgi:hypothetical protein